MGSMILMAIRHRNLAEVAKLDFGKISNSFMRRSDGFPKTFDGSEAWANERDLKDPSPNVVMSEAHHYSESAVLYVNAELLTYCTALMLSRIKEGSGFKAYIGSFRGIVSHDNRRILKSRKPLSRPEVDGDKYSLFGIWTDSMHEIEANPYAMEDAAHFCANGEARERTFDTHGGRFQAICTLQGTEAAIVQLKSSAIVDVIPAYQLQISDEEHAEVTHQLLTENQPLKARKTYIRAFNRELAAGFGYEILSKP
ncbi:hypothetical protein RYA05_00945 [Pseudomonas syringae pv. actinidiae]|nr:hypothetical protein [Pseudomonas syringae pv. actinidiae]